MRSRKHVCVCGRPAERPLPEGIDGLFVKGQFKGYEKICEECRKRFWWMDLRDTILEIKSLEFVVY